MNKLLSDVRRSSMPRFCRNLVTVRALVAGIAACNSHTGRSSLRDWKIDQNFVMKVKNYDNVKNTVSWQYITRRTKYYAVRNGRNPGIYKTWEDCKKEVHGFKAAVFNSFKFEEDAKDFMRSETTHLKKTLENFDVEVFTDGSCIRKGENCIAGWGALLVFPKNELKRYCGPVILDSKHPEFYGSEVLSSNTGELSAIANALRLIRDYKVSSAVIFSDSTYTLGVVQQKYKTYTNQELVSSIQSLLQSVESEGTSISFEKVRAHANITGNEIADRLARRGAEMCEIQTVS